MKKILILAFVAMFASIMITGCEKEINNQSLENELKGINAKIKSDSIKESQNGGFWSKVGKVCAVAGADIVGAVEGAKIGGKTGAIVGTVAGGHTVEGAVIGGAVGGAVVGGGASYAAYRGVKTGIPYPSGYDSEPSSQYVNVCDCGKYHNAYLDELFFTSGIPNMSNLYQEYLYTTMNREMYDSLVNSIGPLSETDVVMNNIIEQYIQGEYDYQVLIDQFIESFGLSLSEEQFLTYFFEVYTSAYSIDNAFMIIDTYIDFLNNEGRSYFTEEEVIVLNCAMSVALYSTDYWSFIAK